MVRAKKVMVKAKLVGFFRELEHGLPGGPSLRAAMRVSPGAHEPEMLGYLKGGTPYVVSPGPVWDVIDREGPVGTATLMTDGEWVWPQDLVHYVQKYHVELPDELVERARSSGWAIDRVPLDRLRSLQLPDE